MIKFARRTQFAHTIGAALVGGICLFALTGCGGGDSQDASVKAGPGISLLAGMLNGRGGIFNEPRGVSADAQGNIYVADTLNHAIRKVTPSGAVTTLAGMPGTSGSADGTGTAARFFEPTGVAVDVRGNVYVADARNDTIRKISPLGVVTTIAGRAGVFGLLDGPSGQATFAEPTAVAVDGEGNVYVSDTFYPTIRKITPDGMVTRLAGAMERGSNDGIGAAARFSYPSGLAVDAAGNVYVADRDNQTIRKITSAGMVSTLAGLAEVSGEVDGVGQEARFNLPGAIAVDGSGTLYVADSGDYTAIANTIRKVTPAGIVTTLAGTAGTVGSTDGVGAAARFNFVTAMTVDGMGNAYAADAGNNTIRKISAVGAVTTLAGTAPISDAAPGTGSADGSGPEARFSNPYDLAVDRSGNVYVADGDSTIRKISTTGLVSTLAGKAGVRGSLDGTGTAATFNVPHGIAVDDAGTVYVADTGNHKIRKISPAGVVTTLAGADWENASGVGFSQSPGSVPVSLAVDGSGTVYVLDTGTSTIRKITASGVVGVLMGPELFNSLGISIMSSVAADATGNVYFADYYTIRRIAPTGAITTLAGAPGVSNATDGVGAQASFRDPRSLTVDGAGNVFVADTGNNTIRKVTPAGVVTTIAGQAGSGSVMLGDLPGSLNAPVGMGVDAAGTLYTISDNSVLRIQLQ